MLQNVNIPIGIFQRDLVTKSSLCGLENQLYTGARGVGCFLG